MWPDWDDECCGLKRKTRERKMVMVVVVFKIRGIHEQREGRDEEKKERETKLGKRREKKRR